MSIILKPLNDNHKTLFNILQSARRERSISKHNALAPACCNSLNSLMFNKP